MTRINFFKPPYLFLSIAVAASFIGREGWAAPNETLAFQREQYDLAQTLLDAKQVEQYQQMRYQIADYPLTPYLDYRTLLVNLGEKDSQEVTAFIQQHQAFPFSARIRAPYLAALAREQRWQAFLTFQPDLPTGETYQCHYYYAQYQTGNREAALAGASTLWRTGHSMPAACDPLFEVWEQAGLKTDERVMERLMLAFEEGRWAIVRYLSKQLQDPQLTEQASKILALLNKPSTIAEYATTQPANAQNHRLTKASLMRWARQDPEAVQAQLAPILHAQAFSAAESQAIAEFIALRLMRTEQAPIAAWRDHIVQQSKQVSLIEQRIRLAIQDADWNAVQQWIGRLPASAQQSSRWQYWIGRTDIALGRTAQGTAELTQLLGQRDFYSAAAAEWLGKPVTYPIEKTQFEAAKITPYHTALVRIEELIERDKIAAAKSEWRWLMYRTNRVDREMLTAYAASKHWHHLTVTGTIMAEMWNHMALRFPLAHQWWFNFYAEQHHIDPVTLISVARQESALDSEARSAVGARGIMQIMPATAQHTADKYKLHYQGADELFDVGKNIEIGSTYLKTLLDQYDGNRILAFAAYNAGPNRVKEWRQRSDGKLDAFAFIETIPFNETRGYVQNILMFETYYRDQLGKRGDFLQATEAKAKY